MAREITFYFDYGSPFTYLAWTQLPGLAERTGAEINHKPMLLGGVFKETGNDSPISVPAKGVYMNRDLERCAARLGVPFTMNSAFPIMTLGLMRGAHAAARAGMLERYSRAVFEAIWNEDRDLNQPETVHTLLAEKDFDADQLIAATQDPAIKKALIDTTGEAVARGVFGAPTFFVGDEMFFGHDRLDFVEAAVKG